jgi:MarR family transcriptional regulator for hemolysin
LFDIEAYDIKRLEIYQMCYPSLMPRPAHQPLGLHLTRVSRIVSRAFDDALATAGGSLPVWLVLISLKSGQLASQRELAAAVGVQGATLTHHLNAMESAGLVTRRRDPGNRRLHVVEVTPDGNALFFRLRDAASAFDRQLRAGLSESEVGQLETLLTRLRDNVSVRAVPASGRIPDGDGNFPR